MMLWERSHRCDPRARPLADRRIGVVRRGCDVSPDEAEAMLRRRFVMYAWTKRETVAINDFILTIREGIAEDVTALVDAEREIASAHTAVELDGGAQ